MLQSTGSYAHDLVIPCGGGLVTKSCPALVTPWTVARQSPLSMGFSRQEYWSGLPFPFPGDLPHPGIEPASPALAGGFFTIELPGRPGYAGDSNEQPRVRTTAGNLESPCLSLFPPGCRCDQERKPWNPRDPRRSPTSALLELWGLR